MVDDLHFDIFHPQDEHSEMNFRWQWMKILILTGIKTLTFVEVSINIWGVCLNHELSEAKYKIICCSSDLSGPYMYLFEGNVVFWFGKIYISTQGFGLGFIEYFAATFLHTDSRLKLCQWGYFMIRRIRRHLQNEKPETMFDKITFCQKCIPYRHNPFFRVRQFYRNCTCCTGIWQAENSTPVIWKHSGTSHA